MIRDARSLTPDDIKDSDICIVGAGAAGITLAVAFAGTSHRVTLLESGGFEQDDETDSLNKGEVVNQMFGPLEGTRLRYFGGTTNQWAGRCATLEPTDFDVCPWKPLSGWPVSMDQLAPYYTSALGTLKIPAHVLQYNTPDDRLKHKHIEPRYRFVQPLRFGREYRTTLESAPNIDVLLYANLIDIEEDKLAGRTSAISVATITNKHFSVRASYFILACGTLENTRILLASSNLHMLSTIRKYGWLGKCFMQHPCMDIGTVFYSTPSWDEGRRNIEKRLGPTDQYRNSKEVLNYLLGIHSDIGRLPHNGFGPLSDSRGDERIPRYLQELMCLGESLNNRAQIRGMFEQSPNVNNVISLSDQRDKLGMPQMRVKWTLNAQDTKTLFDAPRLIACVCGANNAGIVKLTEFMRTRELPDYVWGSYHHMGTYRMSDAPETGVADMNCKIHGTSNLYVTGGGAFPTSGWANPTLTIIALALRLADHLKARL